MCESVCVGGYRSVRVREYCKCAHFFGACAAHICEHIRQAGLDLQCSSSVSVY